MVELSLIILVFMMIALAIMEFSFAFAQNNEIHHAAREGARAAAVGCDGAAVASGSLAMLNPADVAISVTGTQGEEGSTGTIHLTTTYQPITGFFNPIIGGVPLSSDLTFYIERELPGSGTAC